MSPIRWLALGSITVVVIAAVLFSQVGSTDSGDPSLPTNPVAAVPAGDGSQSDSTTGDAASAATTTPQQPAPTDGADLNVGTTDGSDAASVEDGANDPGSDGLVADDAQVSAGTVIPDAPTQAAPTGGGIRLRIPTLGVDAVVSPLGFDGAGGYAVPNTAGGVGWYDFSAYPGAAGNAVLGGHLNWRGSRGVFDRLDELSAGDMVYVDTAAGEIAYQVIGSASLAAETPFVEILGERTGPSTLTLFTCGGTFSTAAGSYDHRTVVNAVRV